MRAFTRDLQYEKIVLSPFDPMYIITYFKSKIKLNIAHTLYMTNLQR